MNVRRLAFVLAVALAWGLTAPIVRADESYDPPAPMQQWLTETANQGTLAPGTTITTANWQQYKQFMPYGMQTLFEGKYFWKMPPDVAMTVGPTVVLPLPKTYVEASEKYGAQTSVGSTPAGHHFVNGYVAGEPFPNPQDLDKGYKVLADVWFSYVPNLYAQQFDHPGVSCTQDRFGSVACSKITWIYRQVGYNTDPDVPQNLPEAGNAWFTEWFMVMEPEQSKYTTNLTVFSKDPEKPEDDYVFVPALRRSLRLAVSARCAPAAGSDFVLDDYKTVGFNGGLALFRARDLGVRKVLALVDDYTMETGKFPDDWDMPLGFPKPSWGKWQVRADDIIDVRRIPSENAGYCYGSRVMYVDSHFHYATWIDIYDSNLALWKMFWLGPRAADVTGVGHVTTNSTSASVWDIQNDHMTFLSTVDEHGVGPKFNSDAPPEYHDYTKYSSPSGLMEIFR
ncbi:MAG: DUF1329 domain-containing protein [Candidatus Binataceae bacterium]|nr:DUF1329 domain-containing protein [Candidatus Binataceae bacterium]